MKQPRRDNDMTASTVTKYQVVTKGSQRYLDGALVAQVMLRSDGWRVVPYTQDAPSRRGWPTPEAAIKRFKNVELVPCVG